MRPKQFKRFLAVGIVPFALLLPYVTEAVADTLTGKVAKIVDGDTIYVLDTNYEQRKIRLARIDAPNESRRMDWLPVST